MIANIEANSSLLLNQTLLLNLLVQIHNLQYFENCIIFEENEIGNLCEGKTNVLINNRMVNGTQLRYYLDKHSLTVIYTSGLMDPILEVAKQVLLGIRTNRVVFILKNNFEDDLSTWFDWIWTNQFINSLVLYGSEVWSYDPFPNIKLLNLTNEVSFFCNVIIEKSR